MLHIVCVTKSNLLCTIFMSSLVTLFIYIHVRTEIYAQGLGLHIQTIILSLDFDFLETISFAQRVSVGSSLFLYTIIASLSLEKNIENSNR